MAKPLTEEEIYALEQIAEGASFWSPEIKPLTRRRYITNNQTRENTGEAIRITDHYALTEKAKEYLEKERG